ncbi:MAG: DUF3791 domain-containing protein [Paludibacter sp.]|jgi:hypothetical protein|nr:DUF3791 domain-containing protein [Paludibacter sp.]
MNDKTKFLAYCIEIYRRAKGLTGKQVYLLFVKFGVLNYVIDAYGALHTTGSQYTIDDIDKFIDINK